MAEKVHITYVDDLDGTEIKDGKGGEVIFGFDGASYAIDLTDKNRKELEKALLPFLDKARPYKDSKRAPKKSSASGAGDAAKIRAWARDNGFDVPERGRVSAEVRAAYQAAH